MAYTYSKIATYTVGSGGIASINFLNIPQNYTDLLLKFSIRTGSANVSNAITVGMNNTEVATSRTLRGSGSAASSFTDTVLSGTRAVGGSATANTFNNAELYIPNYTSGNYKSMSVDGVTENNATEAYSELSANLLSISSPITSLYIYCSGQTISQYSSAHLYGIKAEL